MFDNQMPNVSGNTGGAWGNDYSGRLNDMLAPYQQMMGRINSPYATMGQNGWLQNNHPQVAGVLDNAFLTMGMTPQATGPEGAGGGIARAMQGLIGGQQYNRQRMIQGAMLPYQMVQQQLGAMDTMSQINERNAMVPFRMAQESRMNAQSELYYNRIAQGDRSKALAGAAQIDDKGQSWDRTFDPISGATRLYNPATQKHADELPADQQPSFKNDQRSQRMSTPGGLLGETYNMMNSPDVATRIKGQQLHSQYLADQNAIAGGRAAAVQGVTQPTKDVDRMIAQERATAYQTLEKPQTASQYASSMMDQMASQTPEGIKKGQDYYKNPQASFEKYNKELVGKRQQMDVDFSRYQKSDAPKQGVSFTEYKQNPSSYDTAGPAPAPAKTPKASAPTKSLTFNTATGKLE